ncbi:MAG: SpoIID/LytB domain-containing protein [Candidatus Daviesbacteria bacterium]|nr:SpoIID/LytB domain-containing protein [Candidatus Daviesbacteria bacterium]
MRKVFLLIPLLLLVLIYQPFVIRADEVEDLQKQINELSAAREKSVAATKPLEGQLNALKIQLAQIQNKLVSLSNSIKQKEKDISIRTDKLVVQQSLLSQRVRSYYIRSYMASPLTVIFSSVGSGDLLRELSYRQAATKEDQSVISQVTADMLDLITQKDKLEKDKKSLASMQVEVDKNAAFIGGEVNKAKDYQSTLSKQIASLSAKQQEIINARLGSLNLPTSLGAGPLICTDDRNINPGFSPAFAFFTFGIPHRVGMNQYGALGRAKAGQSAEDILRAYFQNFEFSSGHEGETIKVDGTNEFGQTFNNESMSLDEYLKHLYEMPTSWPAAALQAQAIAARSYGLAIQKSKGYVRPSQSDQVVKKELNSSAWIAAVEATKGKIMSSGGQPIKGWFASTAGGYTFTSADVWGGGTSYTKRMRDTTGDVSSFADLMAKSYDKDSPCLYAAQGYRKEYGKSAWLKSDELADIVNVLLLSRNDSSTQEHLYQPDKGNPAGQETWNADRVKQELRSRSITPFNSISSVSVSADFGSGMTTNVSISGDGGSQSFGGNEFKNFFNLRAPANISIVGPLFNVEKK